LALANEEELHWRCPKKNPLKDENLGNVARQKLHAFLFDERDKDELIVHLSDGRGVRIA